MSLRERLNHARRVVLRTGTLVQERFSSERGENLAAAISMRAFLALFPIVLLAIAAVGFAGGSPKIVARDVADALGLGRDFGNTLTQSLTTAREGRVASSVVGVLGLIWTGTGLSASVNAAWDAAWSIRGGAFRGRALGAVWLVGGLIFLAITAATTVLLQRANIRIELGVIGGVLANSLFCFWTALTLPARRIPWRAMVKPAIIGGIAFEILRVVGAFVVPALVRRSSNVYGTIGAMFALLVWLLIIGRIVVYIAILERVRWERAGGNVGTTG